MTEPFQPYQAWLDLDPRLTAPNYYELIGVGNQLTDPSEISAAADRAMSRVRSFRPGPHAMRWAQLLDEISAAKSCLLDSSARRAYDQQLPDGGAARPAPAEGNSPAVTLAIDSSIDAESADGSPDPTPRADPGCEVPQETFRDNIAPDSGESVPYLQPSDPDPDNTIAPLEGDLEKSDTWVSPLDDDPMAPIDVLADPYPPQARRRVLDSVGSLPTVGPIETDAMAAAPVGPAATGPRPAINPASVPQLAGHDSRSRKTGIPSLVPLMAGISAGLLLTVVVVITLRNGNDGSESVMAETDQVVADRSSSRSAVDEPETNHNGSRRDIGSPTAARPVSSDPADEAPVKLDSDSKVPGYDAYDAELDRFVAEKAESRPAQPDPPDPEMLRQLSASLLQARDALTRGECDDSDAATREAREIAQLPEHVALVERLATLSQLLREFQLAVEGSIETLRPNAEIRLSESTMITIDEATESQITVTVAGMKRKYPRNDLAPGLAIALASRSLGADNPRLNVLKGAFFAVHARSGPEELERVRRWWGEAGEVLPEVRDLLPILDDDYQLAQ